MLGDINIAELKALIGAGYSKVVKETIGKDLLTDFKQQNF